MNQRLQQDLFEVVHLLQGLATAWTPNSILKNGVNRKKSESKVRRRSNSRRSRVSFRESPDPGAQQRRGRFCMNLRRSGGSGGNEEASKCQTSAGQAHSAVFDFLQRRKDEARRLEEAPAATVQGIGRRFTSKATIHSFPKL